MPRPSAVPLDEFRAANWEAFAQFESGFEREFTKYGRSLPPRFYKSIRDDLSKVFGDPAQFLTQGGGSPLFRFKVVLDSNIVVMDSLAVARGKPSTTERVLASPFVLVLAPRTIREESERNIRLKCKRRGLPVEPALSQARRLLARVQLVDPETDPYVRRARELIGVHAPEDVDFLAVALEYQASAVVSRDSAAFDHQSVVRRWELRNLVDSVVAFESGALSIVLVGKGSSALVRALQSVVVAVARALFELLSVALEALAALVNGAIQALARVPAWGWLVALVAIIGVGIYSASHPEFRERVGEGLATLSGGIRRLGEAIVQAGSALVDGLYTLLVWLWNLFLPVTTATVIVAGVLLRRMRALLGEADQLSRTVPTA